MNKMTMLYREGMAELRAENEQLKARIAELEERSEEMLNTQRLLIENYVQREREYEKRIAELEAQQRWILITTKESLPKEEGSYLGYIKYPGGEYFQEEVEYSNKYGWMLDECIDITHWMPLPEPPIVYGKESEG